MGDIQDLRPQYRWTMPVTPLILVPVELYSY
jgi:hypothetical protein